MVAIDRIIGIRERTDAKRTDERPAAVARGDAGAHDGVRISPEAHRAAEVAQLLETSESGGAIRAEQVAQARAALEQGTYRLQRVVLQVVARVSRYVSESLP